MPLRHKLNDLRRLKNPCHRIVLHPCLPFVPTMNVSCNTEPFIFHSLLILFLNRTPEQEVTHNHIHLTQTRSKRQNHIYSLPTMLHTQLSTPMQEESRAQNTIPNVKKRTNLTPTCCLIINSADAHNPIHTITSN
jgi:hypothetical protein